MRIAIFLDHINYQELSDNVKYVFLFDVDQDLITSVGEEIMSVCNVSYLLTWLLAKEVDTIYADGISHAKIYMEKAGITVKPLDEIRDNPIFRSLLLS